MNSPRGTPRQPNRSIGIASNLNASPYSNPLFYRAYRCSANYACVDLRLTTMVDLPDFGATMWI